jgi:hypothetical protein
MELKPIRLGAWRRVEDAALRGVVFCPPHPDVSISSEQTLYMNLTSGENGPSDLTQPSAMRSGSVGGYWMTPRSAICYFTGSLTLGAALGAALMLWLGG